MLSHSQNGPLVPVNGRLRRLGVAEIAVATGQAIVVTGLFMWLLSVLHDRYWPIVAIDYSSGPRCLDPRFFLVNVTDRRVGRGDYVVFRSRGMGPFYPDGTLVIKRVAGVAGDHVVVNPQGVWVNGVYQGDLMHAEPGEKLWKLGHRAGEYQRDEQVPWNRWWVMGTNPRSFDSRYWGYVANEQIVGRARAIW